MNARSNPYGLVKPITRIMRELSPDQPEERAATLDDVRAEVLSPEKVNATVSGVFAGVALLIAVVGVAGVLAFSVSGSSASGWPSGRGRAACCCAWLPKARRWRSADWR